jgi:hypothetical protein
VIGGRSLPKDVIDKWPEIFGEVTLKVVPLCYLHTIKITFKNNRVWEIAINSRIKNGDWDYLELQLKEMVVEYDSEIDSVDFRLDIEKIKKDILKNTKKFLKNKKLK